MPTLTLPLRRAATSVVSVVRSAATFAEFSRDQLGFLDSLGEKQGDVARFEMMGTRFWLLRHPRDVEALLVEHARSVGRDDYVQALQRALGQGLLTSDGELWRRQRRLMAQAFTPKRIATYAEAMVRVAGASLERWRDGASLNLHREMGRIAAEVVSEVLFGTSVSADEVTMVGDALEVLNEFFSHSPEAVFRLPKWLPTPRNHRMNTAVEAIDRLVFRIVRERRSSTSRDDLLGTLLAAQDDDGTRMTDAQLRDEVVTLFLAGHETTALALTHAFYFLSRHPDVERRLHAELAEVLAGRAPTSNDVRSLPFTECVLKEAMRLFPPAWTMGRAVTSPIELGRHRFEKGDQVLVSQWVLHRDARWFPEPERFDPERFNSERVKALPRYAYLPFGAGPRVCIGNHFAMMEAMLLLATIAQGWRIEVASDEQLEFAPSVTLRPKGTGLRATLRASAAR